MFSIRLLVIASVAVAIAGCGGWFDPAAEGCGITLATRDGEPLPAPYVVELQPIGSGEMIAEVAFMGPAGPVTADVREPRGAPYEVGFTVGGDSATDVGFTVSGVHEYRIRGANGCRQTLAIEVRPPAAGVAPAPDQSQEPNIVPAPTDTPEVTSLTVDPDNPCALLSLEDANDILGLRMSKLPEPEEYPLQLTGCEFGPLLLRTRPFTGTLDELVETEDGPATRITLDTPVPAYVGEGGVVGTWHATTVVDDVFVVVDLYPSSLDERKVAEEVVRAIIDRVLGGE